MTSGRTPSPRVLSAAFKEADEEDADLYRALTFPGLFGLLDPPRENVREAARKCRQAGIRVIMFTDDQPVMVPNITEKLGFNEDDRLSPGSRSSSL